jgi:plasmid maintenance system antidote protein VapI
MERRNYESVKYTFNGEEVRELGEALAREAQTVYDLREQKKAATSDFTAKIEAANKRVCDLFLRINNGYELREVECLHMMDLPRPGMKRIIRTDTNETIREEAMTMQEMQGSFGFQEPEKD